MRGKGDWELFLSKMWDCWRGRAWETTPSETGPASASLYASDGSVRMVGVGGLLRKEQEMWESTDRSLQEAFQDLNALMVHFSLKTLYMGLLKKLMHFSLPNFVY